MKMFHEITRKLTVTVMLQLVLHHIVVESAPASDGQQAFPATLYEPTDPLIQLNSTNFDQELIRSPDKAHLVEFYMSWCGHCRHFAPTYVKFARDVESKLSASFLIWSYYNQTYSRLEARSKDCSHKLCVRFKQSHM